MVWSVFGTIIYSSKIEQMNFVKSLFRLFKLNDIINSCNIWLWRRIPHPDTLVSGGPEIDFGIQTDNALILGEAKWKSGVDKYQGKDKKKSQIQLREEFISKYVTKMYESSTQIEMCMQVTLNKTDISVNNISWADIVELPHPLKDEIKRYYDWKYLNCNL
jgi:hypothetical protein